MGLNTSRLDHLLHHTADHGLADMSITKPSVDLRGSNVAEMALGGWKRQLSSGCQKLYIVLHSLIRGGRGTFHLKHFTIKLVWVVMEPTWMVFREQKRNNA